MDTFLCLPRDGCGSAQEAVSSSINDHNLGFRYVSFETGFVTALNKGINGPDAIVPFVPDFKDNYSVVCMRHNGDWYLCGGQTAEVKEHNLEEFACLLTESD